MNASEPPPLTIGVKDNAEITFLISENGSVWSVTKDGAFYGDYLKQKHARGSAQSAVAEIVASGGSARAFLVSGSVADETGVEGPIALDGDCPSPSRYPVAETS